MSPRDTSAHLSALRRYRRAGVIVIALFAGTLSAWAITTRLKGAVMASGQFVVAGEVKKVQHPTGGVVSELRVREGQHVEAGDMLLRLDETIARANHQIVSRQLDEFAARSARLAAERDGESQLATPPELANRLGEAEIARLLAAEAKLFEARRTARNGQREQLRNRSAQLRDEIAGLQSQRAAKERESEIIATEMIGVADLYKRNLIQLTRLSALQRDQASIQGQRGQLAAQIAQAEGRIAEIELQIIQIGEDTRAETMKELREIQAKQGELAERLTAASDQLRRIELRAPVAGIVHQLAVHTVGGVLNSGEPAMLIVPGQAELQLDVRVAPSDVDQIHTGQSVRVKIHAGNQATMPDLTGTVSRIGADAVKDERLGQAFYTVRISLERSEFKKIQAIRFIAGMQAEAFIETGERSPIDFLLKPLFTHFDRTFRER
jgi:HlyD family secretion protein